MTYKELASEINKMTEEQQNCTVTMQDVAYEDECYAAYLKIFPTHDCLDDNHPVIVALNYENSPKSA